ncbi:hypothetical protein EJ08DRAFT_655959 [Tothia fuscella]|uniref:DUF6594 domain-containing protein n=1 Tax=Tothia fuscella TaxID=1048955 RepID=A0A9P4P4B5_9PEZI|nr:hypothetical protein EJ08DRAFT_655959 [Tothia fuscella]
MAEAQKGIRRDGYPAVAKWIAQDPDHEGFIFRRFNRLCARNLLNLQSQLISIETELDALDEDAWKRKDTSLKRWETYEQNVENSNNELAQRQKELYKNMEVKIKEYQEAMLLQSSFAELDKPRNRALSSYRYWFDGGNKNGIALNPILEGRAKAMLDSKEDLAALRSPADKDPLSRFIQDYWIFPGQKLDPRGGSAHFRERHVSLLVLLINLLVAGLLLVGVIIWLYFEETPVKRLIIISVFTGIFGLSIGILTNARRAEIFGASAAYAAVLMVFVSGDLAPKSTS